MKVTSEAWADHRVETTYRDSVGGSVRVFYPSGKLRSYVPYLNIKRHIHHGVSSYYYESGQVRTQEDYIGGKLQGQRLTFYPDGKPKRKESYDKGVFVSGECYGPDGTQVAFFPYEVMPVYSEGTGDKDAVVQAVMAKVQYPMEALRRHVNGVVRILFVVDKNGKVQNVRPDKKTLEAEVPANLRDVYEELQKAAMYGVRHLKSFTPGKQDGEPVDVSYTVPVTFRIK
ncbi:TonB family protein [Hymenobacter sp. GOD-10R]|uniref:TonB family protein n=1 Tax=Hymenobacter sp. GOD-10R TaxID=3093922 RepID=UPI002D7A099D|nr:TonB family protein [Hymenobacter sp. GOD-10R]WRQ31017.1 TonB family protein [Hymenobacter sp. GOD-10R]